jgi:hypothetical protein
MKTKKQMIKKNKRSLYIQMILYISQYKKVKKKLRKDYLWVRNSDISI